MTRRSIVHIAVAAASVALALAPSRAVAQGAPRGPFIGVGVGMEGLREQSVGDERFGVMLHARAGWGLAGSVTPMLEMGFHGLGDDEPQFGDVVIINQFGGPTPSVVRRPSMLSTITALASVQVGLPRAFYVRPSVGIGYHAFPFYDLGSDTPMVGTSHEAGPAAGLAIGRTLNPAGRFPVAVEGVGLWSHGEDSTGSRWAAGIQVVPMIRF